MSIEQSRKEINSLVIGHLRHVSNATIFVKGVLLIGGALIAGTAQFADIEASGIEPFQIVGIVGCVLVALGALWSTWKDQDSTLELKAAAEAIEKAEAAQELADQADDAYEDMDRAANLIVATNSSMNFLEALAASPGMSEEDLLESIFSMMARHIVLSMELTWSNEWTLCCYRAEPHDGERTQLRLIDHARAIKCEKSDARTWADGVGVAGICYASNREMIVPDFQADGVGSLFNVGQQERHYDQSRYQSIVAVPINVVGDANPWGILTATSDRKNHFTLDEDGLSYSEGARVLAKSIALAIALNRKLAGRVAEA